MKKQLLIELPYCPPVSFFVLYLHFETVCFDIWANYEKASYRNRCHIAGANGLLRMSIPLQRGKHQHRAFKEVLIHNESAWQVLHWTSICSAYRQSPYFEFFEDSLYPVFHQQQPKLFDFNLALFEWIIQQLRFEKKWACTRSYESEPAPGIMDLRNCLAPNPEKSKIPFSFRLPVYHQVFDDRYDFLPDLSVLDLLFNEGPKAAPLIREASRTI